MCVWGDLSRVYPGFMEKFGYNLMPVGGGGIIRASLRISR